MFVKLKGAEVAIDSANNVGGASAIRVVNTGNDAVVNLAYANGLVYANTTVQKSDSIVLVKSATDLVIGSSMRAAPVECRG